MEKKGKKLYLDFTNSLTTFWQYLPNVGQQLFQKSISQVSQRKSVAVLEPADIEDPKERVRVEKARAKLERAVRTMRATAI